MAPRWAFTTTGWASVQLLGPNCPTCRGWASMTLQYIHRVSLYDSTVRLWSHAGWAVTTSGVILRTPGWVSIFTGEHRQFPRRAFLIPRRALTTLRWAPRPCYCLNVKKRLHYIRRRPTWVFAQGKGKRVHFPHVAHIVLLSVNRTFRFCNMQICFLHGADKPPLACLQLQCFSKK